MCLSSLGGVDFGCLIFYENNLNPNRMTLTPLLMLYSYGMFDPELGLESSREFFQACEPSCLKAHFNVYRSLFPVCSSKLCRNCAPYRGIDMLFLNKSMLSIVHGTELIEDCINN